MSQLLLPLLLPLLLLLLLLLYFTTRLCYMLIGSTLQTEDLTC
jgi:hypothetical protein